MNAGSRTIRVFLVAEHAALRQNLTLLLEGESMVVNSSGDDPGEALREMPAATDVVIIALSEARQGLWQLLQEIDALPDAPPSLVVSVHEDEHTIRGALAAGARAYVPSRKASTALVYAIHEVVSGRSWAPLPAARNA